MRHGQKPTTVAPSTAPDCVTWMRFFLVEVVDAVLTQHLYGCGTAAGMIYRPRTTLPFTVTTTPSTSVTSAQRSMQYGAVRTRSADCLPHLRHLLLHRLHHRRHHHRLRLPRVAPAAPRTSGRRLIAEQTHTKRQLRARLRPSPLISWRRLRPRVRRSRMREHHGSAVLR